MLKRLNFALIEKDVDIVNYFQLVFENYKNINYKVYNSIDDFLFKASKDIDLIFVDYDNEKLDLENDIYDKLKQIKLNFSKSEITILLNSISIDSNQFFKIGIKSFLDKSKDLIVLEDYLASYFCGGSILSLDYLRIILKKENPVIGITNFKLKINKIEQLEHKIISLIINNYSNDQIMNLLSLNELEYKKKQYSIYRFFNVANRYLNLFSKNNKLYEAYQRYL